MPKSVRSWARIVEAPALQVYSAVRVALAVGECFKEMKCETLEAGDSSGDKKIGEVPRITKLYFSWDAKKCFIVLKRQEAIKMLLSRFYVGILIPYAEFHFRSRSRNILRVISTSKENYYINNNWMTRIRSKDTSIFNFPTDIRTREESKLQFLARGLNTAHLFARWRVRFLTRSSAEKTSILVSSDSLWLVSISYSSYRWTMFDKINYWIIVNNKDMF